MTNPNMRRGLMAFSDLDEAHVVVNKVNYLGASVIKQFGQYRGSCVILWFSDERQEIEVPVLTAPLDNARATQLLINVLTEKHKPDAVLLSSAAHPLNQSDECNSVIAHYETKDDPERTIDIIGRFPNKANPKLELIDDNTYERITHRRPYDTFPLYGFYKPNEEGISRDAKKRILKSANKVIESIAKAKLNLKDFKEEDFEVMSQMYRTIKESYQH